MGWGLLAKDSTPEGVPSRLSPSATTKEEASVLITEVSASTLMTSGETATPSALSRLP